MEAQPQGGATARKWRASLKRAKPIKKLVLILNSDGLPWKRSRKAEQLYPPTAGDILPFQARLIKNMSP